MEDSLPKTVCIECQRHIEQFNAFKVKCARAEEKLKLLASGSKPHPVVKQEAVEVEADVPLCPTIEHSYCSTVMPPAAATNVKMEVPDEYVATAPVANPEEQIEDETQCADAPADVCYDDLLDTFSDIKQPIELIVDDEGNIRYNTEETPSKLEVDVLHYEAKPVVEVTIEDYPELPPAPDSNREGSEASIEVEELVHPQKKRRKHKHHVIDFKDEDLMLREGEECDIDMEQMEAMLMKKANPEIRFKCRTCRKSFKFFKGLRKHQSTHGAEDQAYGCHFCLQETNASYEFKTLKSLQTHLFTKHLKDEDYRCKMCSKTFRTRLQCKYHEKRSHDSPSYKCKDCFKVFQLKSILKSHMRVHSKNKTLSCKQCEKKFRWPGALRYHIQTHRKEKGFLCAECGRQFASLNTLQEHTFVHRGEKPYSCLDCAVSFSHISSLKKHSALHRTARHRCGTCHRGFSQAFLLKQHESVHTGARPLACSDCSMTFRTKSNLCNHVKIHGAKIFECFLCEYKCSKSRMLKDHMVRHTGCRHICPAPGCTKQYTQRFPLTKHFRKHHPEMEIVSKKGGRRKGDLKNELPSADGVRYSFLHH